MVKTPWIEQWSAARLAWSLWVACLALSAVFKKARYIVLEDVKGIPVVIQYGDENFDKFVPVAEKVLKASSGRATEFGFRHLRYQASGFSMGTELDQRAMRTALMVRRFQTCCEKYLENAAA